MTPEGIWFLDRGDPDLKDYLGESHFGLEEILRTSLDDIMLIANQENVGAGNLNVMLAITDGEHTTAWWVKVRSLSPSTGKAEIIFQDRLSQQDLENDYNGDETIIFDEGDVVEIEIRNILRAMLF